MKKVVVADDNEVLLNQLVNSLKMCDEIEIVGIAKDGEEELEYIKNEKPDVAVTDIEMPKKTGVDVIEIAKDFDSSPEFIVITGGASFETMQKLNKLPVKHIFQKPLNTKNLVEEILREEDREELTEQERIQKTESNTIFNKIKNLIFK